MAGRFSNTRYTNTVSSVLGSMQSLLKNNFYKFSELPPTPVEYFHLNKDASTLDEGSRLAYNSVGEDSPFWFNQIHNMMLYGINTPMEIQYSNEEFGMESASIEGDCVVLPNTVVPCVDDQFIIKYLQSEVIFKVIHVDPDTLEDGSNAYKIQYRSSTSTKEDLLKQIVEEYYFVIENVGTHNNCLIKAAIANFIDEMDIAIATLKKMFINIFYNSRVQTFVYNYLGQNFYDPFMIEFLREHRILDGAEQYIYVNQQTKLPPMFPVHYMQSFFYCLEKKDYKNLRKYNHRGRGFLIQDKFTIFANRMEPYWEVNFVFDQQYEALSAIPCFLDELINHIEDGETFTVGPTFYNVILKYFYDKDITTTDLEQLDKINYANNVTLFYAIPCIIYCLESSIGKIISN